MRTSATSALLVTTVALLACTTPAQDGCLHFDGNLGQSVVATSATAFPTEFFTVAAFIKPDQGVWPNVGTCDLPSVPCGQISTPAHEPGSAPVAPLGTIVSLRACEPGQLSWLLCVSRCGTLAFVADIGGAAERRFDTGVYVADDKWHFVAVSRAADGVIQITVDCIGFQCTGAPAVDLGCGSDLVIGASMDYDGDSGYGFHGLIDEVTLFDRGLRDEERAFLRTSLDLGDVALDGSAIAQWKFDEGSGKLAMDSVGDRHAFHHGASAATGGGPTWRPNVAPTRPMRCNGAFAGQPFTMVEDFGRLSTVSPGFSPLVFEASYGTEYAAVLLDDDAAGDGNGCPSHGTIRVDAYSSGLDIIPIDDAGRLRDSIGGQPIWASFNFSIREGSTYAGSSVFAYSWGGLFPNLGNNVSVVQPTEAPVLATEASSIDFGSWLHDLETPGANVWGGEPPSPHVYFSVTEDSDVPAAWGKHVSIGGTIYEMTFNKQTQKYGCPVKSKDLNLRERRDVDALAYDATRRVAIYSTENPHPTPHAPEEQPMFAFYKKGASGSSAVMTSASEFLDTVVHDELGLIDPDGISILDPTQVERSDPNAVAARTFVDWTVGLPLSRSHGPADAMLNVYLDRGISQHAPIAHRIVVCGAPPGPVTLRVSLSEKTPESGPDSVPVLADPVAVVEGESLPPKHGVIEFLFDYTTVAVPEDQGFVTLYYQVTGVTSGGLPWATNVTSIKTSGV